MFSDNCVGTRDEIFVLYIHHSTLPTATGTVIVDRSVHNPGGFHLHLVSRILHLMNSHLRLVHSRLRRSSWNAQGARYVAQGVGGTQGIGIIYS